VYQDDAILPENLDAIKKIRDSGLFERMANRLTKAVALPHDLQIVVTDKTPKGIDDPSTEADGRKIWWPPAFSKATHDVLTEFLPEVIASKGPPRAISQENFIADVLNVWANQFILGHEFGHALIRQLNVPLTGLEEDSADGFATFFTVNDKDTGPNAALGAAVLFDAMGSKKPNLTLEDFSSDHPVILQRVYNFLCCVVGSDPHRCRTPSSLTVTSLKSVHCSAGRNGPSSTTAGGLCWSRTLPTATRKRRRRPGNKLSRIWKKRTRSCLTRSGRSAADSEGRTTNRHQWTPMLFLLSQRSQTADPQAISIFAIREWS
jgi:hypothetical protein